MARRGRVMTRGRGNRAQKRKVVTKEEKKGIGKEGGE